MLNGLNISGVSESAFRVLNRLQSLIMDNCLLKSAPSLDYVGQTLEHLSLQNNQISHIPQNYFYNCIALKIVQLTRNILQSVPNLIPLNETIEWVLLDHNKLTQFHINCYDKEIWPSLKILDLRHNYLSLVSDLSCLRYAPTVRLEYNPFNCSEEMNWIMGKNTTANRSVQPHRIAVGGVMIYDNPNILCHFPPEMKGKQLMGSHGGLCSEN